MSELKGDVQAALDAAQHTLAIQTLQSPFDDLTIPVVVTRDNEGSPSATSLIDLFDPVLPRPRRRTGHARHTEASSFIDHVNRFRANHSTLWALINEQSASIAAVLNYHRAGEYGQPEHGDHRSTYTLPLSKEWLAWIGVHGRSMSQADFAEFIEEHLIDVASPDHASDDIRTLFTKLETQPAKQSELVQLSKGLKVHIKAEVSDATNLNSGETDVTFKTEHTDAKGQKLRVPNGLVIEIPVFEQGAKVQLAAFLRYRLDGNRMSWIIKVYGAKQVRDREFRATATSIADATSLPLFFGAPE